MKTSETVPAVFEAALATLRDDIAAHYGAAALELNALSSEERLFSHLLLLAVTDTETGRRLGELYVKVYKAPPERHDSMRERVRNDFEATRRVYAGMKASAELGVVRPVACSPNDLTLITERAPGETLLNQLVRHTTWFPARTRVQDLVATAATVGRWLRTFQSLEAPGEPLQLADYRAYVDHRLQRLTQHAAARVSEVDRARTLTHIERLWPHIPPDDLRDVPIHADMALANVLVSGPRVIVLDFAMARRGSRLHDLTRVYVQLDMLTIKPHVNGAVIRELQRALVDGFDSNLTARHPLFRLSLLLHRINHLTTATVRPAAPLARVYNHFVRRRHRRWLTAELDRAERTESWP